MRAWVTTYRCGDRIVEVRPGESHSDAWTFVTTGSDPVGAMPASRPRGCAARVHRRRARPAPAHSGPRTVAAIR
jgi:hypothetical protein